MPKRIEEIAKGRTNLFSLTWRQCEPAVELIADNRTKLNTRQDFGDIPEFAMSLIDGVKETLLGYMGKNGKFQITNGERRWLGAKWLEEKKSIKILLPIRREEKSYTVTERNLDLLRTNNGKPLEMIEKAAAMQRLLVDGLTEKLIAEKAGCSVTHVTDCLTLLNDVAPEVQKEVRDGTVKASLAIDLARSVPDKERQVELVKEGKAKAEAAKTISKGTKPGSRSIRRVKVTAKHLAVETGKKAQAKKKKAAAATPAPKPLTQPALKSAVMTNAAAPLEELLDAVQRSDCRDSERYDTLEFCIEYMLGRKSQQIATKFILGII